MKYALSILNIQTVSPVTAPNDNYQVFRKQVFAVFAINLL
jgi:hypothetical protein